MKSAQEKFMNSFKETRQGTIIQKYKLKVVVADEPGTSSSQDGRTKGAKGGVDGSGDKGAEPRDGEVEDIGEEDAEEQEPPRCNNFQNQVDYAVQHALTNQSGVLVNTLTNMIKSVVDGTITEHQNTGPVFLPNGVFPQYKNLVTGNQQHTANAPPVQPTAAVSALATGAPSSAQRQVVNPHVLTREQPQHVGQNINRLTQEQIAAMFAPTQPTVEPVQPTPIRQHVIQPIKQQTVQQIPTGQRTPIAQKIHLSEPSLCLNNRCIMFNKPLKTILVVISISSIHLGHLKFNIKQEDHLSLSFYPNSINSIQYSSRCKECPSRSLGQT
jgi:hypothetical protein